MADLYRTEYEQIRTRASQQDLDNILQVLDRDGSIAIVDDPSTEEILKAREQQIKDDEKRQKDAEAQAEKEAREAEEEGDEFDTEADKTRRAAALPVPEDSETAIDETYADVEADTAEAKQKKDEPKDQKKATGR